MARRQYTKREKLTAIVAADMTTQEAAATATGIPRTTIRYWLNDPALAELRQKTREAMAEEVHVAAQVALSALVGNLMDGRMEPRDVTTAFGVLVDKAQLLSGHATERLETRDLTATMGDHERAQLRDAIERWLAETTEGSTGVDAAAVGAGVRE